MATLQEFAASRQSAGATGLKAFTVSKVPTEWKPISVTKKVTVTPTKTPTKQPQPIAPIKITPGAKKVDLNLLQQAQQTMTGIGQKVGGAIGKLASFLPEKNAPIKITPGQKKIDTTQLKQLEGYKPPQADSATLTTQAKDQTIQKLKAVQDKYKTKPIEQVKRDLPKDYKKPTLLGEMGDILNEGFANMAQGLGSSAEMVGNMTNMILLTKAGEKIRRESENALAANPEWASDEPIDKWTGRKILRLGLGAVPSLLASVASGILGKAASFSVGFGQEAGPTYKEAKDAGVPERQAQLYGTAIGVINGYLETLLPSKVFAPQKKAAVDTAKKIGKELAKDIFKQAGKYGLKIGESGLLEGTTEAMQEMMSNVVATNYDKNRKLWDNLAESFVGGALSGGVVGGGADIARSKITDNLQGENDPQTVINEVIKQKAENTEEGKALIKEAIVAQKTGEKVMIEKSVEGGEKTVTQISKEATNSLENKEIGVKPGAIERAKSEIEAGKLPPVKLRTLEDGTTVIEDGRHHLEAARQLGLKTYPTEDVTKFYQPKEIKAKEVSVPKEQLPVGEGKEKVSRLEARMKGVMDSVTEEQIQNLGLTTYQQMNKKETIAKAAEYVSTNRDDAIKVLRGDLEAPKGIPPEALYIALTQASKEDATLITKLASLQATAIGQRLSLLTELDTDSPVKLLNEVYKIREEQAKKKYKNLKKVVDTGVENAKKEIKTVSKYDWNEFISSLEC